VREIGAGFFQRPAEGVATWKSFGNRVFLTFFHAIRLTQPDTVLRPNPDTIPRTMVKKISGFFDPRRW
jgi:hypothetical protein